MSYLPGLNLILQYGSCGVLNGGGVHPVFSAKDVLGAVFNEYIADADPFHRHTGNTTIGKELQYGAAKPPAQTCSSTVMTRGMR